ncbi:hypothetical protein Y1Q_0022364 [Alligator mississippiensis]|uniref:Amine oxidase domain-containing protein n=1 Tax=Alligator mississippiensis TaxID=8496 RepID=A0A151LYJ8_ALLMI|nr:hypothetical protein Y1Q_0022364 [Alligator mississippiensis]
MTLEVTVLETSGSVGGRVKTYRDETQDWYVELGAMRLPRGHRIVREFIRQFHLKLKEFSQMNDNAWYLVNGIRARVREVKQNPNMLNYTLYPKERGKSPSELYRETLQTVIVLETSGSIGGRVKTYRDETQDWYVELGAMRLPRSHRIVREFIRQFHLKLNEFSQMNDNAWYLVNGIRARPYPAE